MRSARACALTRYAEATSAKVCAVTMASAVSGPGVLRYRSRAPSCRSPWRRGKVNTADSPAPSARVANDVNRLSSRRSAIATSLPVRYATMHGPSSSLVCNSS